MTSQLAPANAAVRLDTTNPDAHYVRATILEASDLTPAIAEHYQAALARPDDYVLWLSLARARELNGETDGAIAAARQAVPLAPDYAEPHYQLGNILLRAGQNDEAFKELSLAGTSNPTLLPGIIDLAWRTSGKNASYVEHAFAPGSVAAYRALGDYFRQQKELDAAIAMYTAAGSAAIEDRRSFVAELIAGKHFREAAILWGVDQPASAKPGVMIDPGFEQESNLREGFGWSLGEADKGFRLSLDTNKPQEGKSSLKVEFTGNSESASPVISQLILIEPSAHYQLHFAGRSEDLVSGGLPLVAVIDAEATKIVGQSEQFSKATDGWREYTIDFVTGPSTDAVQIALQRQPCERSPCPIFGRLWLDNFSLKKL